MAFITWTIYSVSQRERQQQANSSSATSLVSSVENQVWQPNMQLAVVARLLPAED